MAYHRTREPGLIDPAAMSAGLPNVSNTAAMWFASDLGLTDGDPVSSWVDQIGFYSATNTGSNRPTYDEDGIGGKPSVNFASASTQYLRYAATNAVSTATSGCVVAVVQLISSGSSGFIWASSDEGTDGSFLTAYKSSSDGSEITKREAFGTQETVATTSSVTTGLPIVLEWTTTGTVWDMRVDNSIVATSTTSGSNEGSWFGDVGLTSSRDNFVLGALRRTSVVSPFNGRIAFLGVYDSQLSTPDRNSLYGWINSYYGITMS